MKVIGMKKDLVIRIKVMTTCNFWKKDLIIIMMCVISTIA